MITEESLRLIIDDDQYGYFMVPGLALLGKDVVTTEDYKVYEKAEGRFLRRMEAAYNATNSVLLPALQNLDRAGGLRVTLWALYLNLKDWVGEAKAQELMGKTLMKVIRG